MIYGSNLLCKKTRAELLLLKVKSRSHESYKGALKYKSILIPSLLSSTPSPYGTCYFEICRVLAWFGVRCKLMGDLGFGGGGDWLCVCDFVVIVTVVVWGLLFVGFGVFFNLTDVPSLGLAEGTDDKTPRISVCSGGEIWAY